MTDAPLLEIRDLRVSFWTPAGELEAVSGIDLDVGDGEVLGVVGESGSGKSVAMKAVLGLLPGRTRVSGSIRFRGRDLLTLREREMRRLRGGRIAMIFQDPLTAFNPVVRVGDQIAEMLYLTAHGLTELSSGNVSCRQGEGILISPNGATAETIRPGSFVRVDDIGNVLGPGRPSSELPMHLAIYRRVPHATAIVHTHSDNCVALASCGIPIPGFHYLVGGFGGDDIPCVPYATFGSEELAEFACEALLERKACLLGNHGAVCRDSDIEAATIRAHRLEILARQYVLALSVGKPRLLTESDWEGYHQMAEKFRYG